MPTVICRVSSKHRGGDGGCCSPDNDVGFTQYAQLTLVYFCSCRPRLGESEPRSPDLHRVFGDPPEPGHPPVQGPVSGPGRVAAGAHQGDDGHRQRARQQRVGGEHAGTPETWTGRQQVGNCVWSRCLLEVLFQGEVQTRRQNK